MKKKEMMFLFGLIILGYFLIHWTIFSVNGDRFVSKFFGTDTYTRLVRVEEFHESKDWYDHVLKDSNAPYGDEIHWTKPFELILYGGAIALTPWWSFKEALSIAGIWISPIIGAFTLIALLWGLRKFMTQEEMLIFCLLFISQMGIQAAMFFGRPDHHSLLLLCFALFIGTSLEVISKRFSIKYILYSALIGTLALWISVESLVFVGLLIVALALLWAIYGEQYGNKLWKFSGLICIFTMISVVIEAGISKIGVQVYDRLSIVHAFIFGLISIVFFLADKFEISKPKARFLSCFIMMFVGIAAVFMVYPKFLKGPFVDVNPEILPIWLSKVREVQPVNKLDVAIRYLGVMLTGVLFLVFRIYKRSEEKLKENLFFLIGTIIFIVLTAYQIRWSGYGQLISLLPVTLLISGILKYTQKLKFKELINVGVIFTFTFGFLITSMFVMQSKPTKEFKPLIYFTDYIVENNIDDGNMLAFIDYGPQIMYRTDLKVVSAPYHRNDSGILFEYEVMSSMDMEFVRNKLKERSIKYILISDGESETNYYDKENNKMFHNALKIGNEPSFIKRIILPEELKNYKLFVVVENM